MKKLLLSLLLVMLVLSSCSNQRPHAELTAKNDVILKVDNESLTNETVWNMLKNQSTTINRYIINQAQQAFFSTKVPVDEELMKQAKLELESYKAQFGEAWPLIAKGNSDETLINDQFIPLIQESKFFELYYTENQAEILKNTSPVKLILLQFADQTTADNALADLNNQVDVAQVANKYLVKGITNNPKEQLIAKSKLSAAVVSALESGLELNKWAFVKDANLFVLVYPIETDSTKLADEYKDAFLADTAAKTSIIKQGIKQLGLMIHDQDVYDNLLADQTFGEYIK